MTAPAMNMSCLSSAALILFSFLIVAVVLYLISRHPMMQKRYLSQIAHFHDRRDLSLNRMPDFPALSPCEVSLLTGDSVTVAVTMIVALVEKKVLKLCNEPEFHIEVTGSGFESCDYLEKTFISLVDKADGAMGKALHQFLKEVSLSLSMKVWTKDKSLLRKVMEDRALLVQEIVKERGTVTRTEELLWALIPETGRKDLPAIVKLSADISLSLLFSGVQKQMSHIQAFLGLTNSEVLAICRFFDDDQDSSGPDIGKDGDVVVKPLKSNDQKPDHISDQCDDQMITGEEITAAVERVRLSLQRNYKAFRSMIDYDITTMYTRITGKIMKQLDDHFEDLSEEDRNTFERVLTKRKEEGKELERFIMSAVLQNEKHLDDEEERLDFRDDIRDLNPELEKRESELRLKRDMVARELFSARVERESLSSPWSRIRYFRRANELRNQINAKEEAQREIQRSLWEVRALWEQVRRAHLSLRIDERAQWALAVAERAALLTESSFLRSAPSVFFREWALSDLLVNEWKASSFLNQNLLQEYTALREKRDSYLSVTCNFSLLNEWLQSIRINLSSQQGQSQSFKLQFQEQYIALLRVLETVEQCTMSSCEEYLICFSRCDEERRKSLKRCQQTDTSDVKAD